MAQRVSKGGMGMRTRKKTFVAKSPTIPAVVKPPYYYERLLVGA